MRVLVTGASGFVGTHVAAALEARGAEVLRLSRHPRPGWHAADLLAGPAPVRALRPDIVVHCAWCVEPGAFWTDPANERWIEATRALAEAAADAGAHRFVGLGTCWEYDWPAEGDCVEGVTPLARHTPYDEAKARTRETLAALCDARGIGFAWARLFFLYGEGEDPRRLVAGVARALARGEAASCSRGTAVRDFLDVAEAGGALAALALSEVTGAVNIGSGEGTSVAALATRLGRLAGRPELVRLGALPDRADEPPRIVADVRRLREEVGFAPRAPNDASLARVLAQARSG